MIAAVRAYFEVGVFGPRQAVLGVDMTFGGNTCNYALAELLLADEHERHNTGFPATTGIDAGGGCAPKDDEPSWAAVLCTMINFFEQEVGVEMRSRLL